MATTSLINRYRPAQFDQVFGNQATIQALERAMQSESHPHTYLLTGPTGVGKTTLARIIAKNYDAELVSIDAASHSGVDDARQIVDESLNVSMRTVSGRRAMVIDECHALSKRAWDALLAATEEPPSHLYFMLCTTEPDSLPATIKSRAYPVVLKSIPPQEIDQLITAIAELEMWQVNPDVMTAIVQVARGSARLAINILQSAHDCQDPAEVHRISDLMDMDDETSALVRLCRAIIQGRASWPEIRKCLLEIDDDEFKRALTGACRYITTVMIKSEHENSARNAWQIADALMFPSAGFDPKAQFIVAVGRCLWSGR